LTYILNVRTFNQALKVRQHQQGSNQTI